MEMNKIGEQEEGKLHTRSAGIFKYLTYLSEEAIEYAKSILSSKLMGILKEYYLIDKNVELNEKLVKKV